MLMPSLLMPFHPPATPTSRPRARGLLLGLVAGATCLGVSALSAQTSDADIAQLKAQMAQMQHDYETRLAAMEGQMKSMEAQVALSGSIAQSRTLTGPDGKEISLKGGPVVVPALDTFTRNFKWHGYVRLGTGFSCQWGRPDLLVSRPRTSATGVFVLATKTTSIWKWVRSWITCSGTIPT